MSINIIANSRAYVALLAALPGLGVTVAEGQTPLQALQARLAAAPATPAAPSAEQVNAAALKLLIEAGLPTAEGAPSATAALKAFLAEIDGQETLLATANASVATLTAQLATANARADLFATALAGKGIKINAKDPKAPTAAEIDAAIEARISTRAAELLAQTTGTPPAAAAPVAGAGSEAAKPTATTGKELEAVAEIYAKRRGAK